MITKEYKTVRYEMSVYYEHQRFDITSNFVSIPCVIKKIQGKNITRRKTEIHRGLEQMVKVDNLKSLEIEMKHFLDEILRKKMFSKMELINPSYNINVVVKNMKEVEKDELKAIIVTKVEKVACEVTYDNRHYKMQFPTLKEALYADYKILKKRGNLMTYNSGLTPVICPNCGEDLESGHDLPTVAMNYCYKCGQRIGGKYEIPCDK